MYTLFKTSFKILSATMAFAFIPAWSKAETNKPKEAASDSRQATENKGSGRSTLNILKAMGHVKEVDHSMRDGTQSEGGGITIGR